jgi:glycosyltransferase involved in cell wall biosynthesis
MFAPRAKDPAAPPTVGYVGKLIASKGVHNLLAALGFVTTRGVSVVVVGYGGFERGLQELWTALRTRDAGLARSIAEREAGQPLRHLLALFDSPGADDAYWDRIAGVSLKWTGRLEHGPLSELLPVFDALVVPSVLAEAFGMVAAEAAACGVLPIVPRHSGIGEVGEAIEEALGVPGLLSFDPAHPIDGTARRIDAVLGLPFETRRELGQEAAALARERWSWDHVAQRLLDVAVGA